MELGKNPALVVVAFYDTDLEEAELVTTEKVGRVRRCMVVPYAFEGISTRLQRLDRFAQVVRRTKGAR